MSLLEDWIKDLNMLETAKREKKFARILSIDFVKGLAIFLIILGHTADTWIAPHWRYAYAWIYLWMDVFGPSMFIFLSALSVVFVLKKREGIIPEHVIRKIVFTRGIVIMVLGVVYNMFTIAWTPYPVIWGWNILMFIGMAQIMCYYAIKLSRGMRFFLGAAIIFLTNDIRTFLYLNKDSSTWIYILHFIVVSPAPHLTLVPYLSICFWSTIFGEMFYEANLLETREAYMDVFRKFIQWGVVFIFIGVFFGLQLVTPHSLDPTEYHFIELVNEASESPIIEIKGAPLFLIRGTPQNCFYSLGCALLILGILFYLIDIRHADNYVVDMLIFYGRVSLSMFFIHYIGLFLYYKQLDIYFFFPAVFAYAGFLGFIMWTWHKYADGKGSFEWIMTTMTGKKKKS